MKKNNNILILAFGILFSALALWLTFKDIDFASVKQELLSANYWWLIPAVLLFLVSNFGRGMRWRAMLQDIPSPKRIFFIVHTGYMVSNILPFRLGELARVYLVSREKGLTTMQAFSTAVLERLLDVLVVTLFMVLLLPLVPSRGIIVQGGQIAAVVAVVGLAGMFIAAWQRDLCINLATKFSGFLPQKARELLLKMLANALDGIRAISVRDWVRAIVWTLFIWIISGLSCYALLLAFWQDAPWFAGMFSSCLLALGLGVPSVPSGLGVFEYAVTQSLKAFHLVGGAPVAYAIVLHLMNFVLINVIGAIGMSQEGESWQHLINAAQRMAGRETEKA
ncbi:MAG TPA: lysylphosphatidylglycerol synthase transmembrane domain-containing protein [Anaerolineales bacterium]|nr:lysylphosphatidylglycerol synthase transmembrane domain-containing protein [Anaerolineales bacterium]